MSNNTWKRIEKPDQVNIETGKAYWVFCNGGSQYVGPLEIVVPGTGNDLDFSRTIPQWELTFINHSPDPLSFTVTPISNSVTDAGVPLSIQSYTNLTEKVFTFFENPTPPMNLEAEQSLKFTLSIRRNSIGEPKVSSLLKIADDLGNPDHQQGKNITRQIQLTISATQDNHDPDDDQFSLAGTYQESTSGLHKIPIKIAGSFSIQRISEVDVLNQ